jgi:thiamine biosynthesis lipoprotein
MILEDNRNKKKKKTELLGLFFYFGSLIHKFHSMKIHYLYLFLLILMISCKQPSNPASVVDQPKHQQGISDAHKIVLQGEAQGTYYAISYYDSLHRNLKLQIDSLLAAFDQSASNYQDSSIISMVNKNMPVELDEIFVGNFKLAQRVSQMTNGSFDITVRPLVELWGFGHKAPEEVSAAEVDSVMRFVGYQKVTLQDNRIDKTDERIQLDFNAIAQGYSVDVVGAFLSDLGIDNYLIDIGGEVLAKGFKPDHQSWKVGVERPEENVQYGSDLSAIVQLNNQALATSGNYRKFYEKDGVKYSHTIDPKSGYPIRSTLLSATVMTQKAAMADALATAFMVMGLQKSKEFLEVNSDIEALLIYSDDSGKYQIYMTAKMEQWVEKISSKNE